MKIIILSFSFYMAVSSQFIWAFYVLLTYSIIFVYIKVIFTDAVRAERYHDQIPPHVFKFEHNAADPYEREIGTQVLMDILLLAKCDQFLHTESSVASLASYFNPHMTSYFLQDEKTDKVCRAAN